MNKTHLGLAAGLILAVSPIISRAQEAPKKKSRFAVAVNLVQVTEDNVGFGLNYEHFLNDQGSVSFYLPFSYSLPASNGYQHIPTDERFYYPHPNQYGSTYVPLDDKWQENKGMAYLYPGVKFYTGKKLARVSYCIGASLVAGLGQAELTTIRYKLDTVIQGGQEYYRRTVSSTTNVNVGRLKLGMMVTNALNIRVGNHIYTGLELGLGYSYINRQDGVNQHRSALAQIGLKLGYYR